MKIIFFLILSLSIQNLGALGDAHLLYRLLPGDPVKDGEITDPEIDFEIAPNPVRDLFIMNFTKVSPEGEVQVVNSIGQVVYKQKVDKIERIQINASDFNNGIYFVRFISQDTNIVKRLVVSSD